MDGIFLLSFNWSPELRACKIIEQNYAPCSLSHHILILQKAENSSHIIVHPSRKNECELDNLMGKHHGKVTGKCLSMDVPCLKRFGENFGKMFPESF